MDNSGNKLITNNSLISLVKISGFSACLQLFSIVIGILVIAIIGARPDSVLEYYKLVQENKINALLQDDFFSLILITLYLFTFSGLFFILMTRRFTLAFYATLLTFIAVILCINSHSGFSLMHLGELYGATTDEALKLQLAAAGESVIAQNIWNSTAAFFSGIFLQGGGVLISLAMLGQREFRKLTILSGLFGNGLDLLQHLLHYSFPAFPQIILYVIGPFYLLWFFMLALDLFKYSKRLATPGSN